jgi:CubicO group peptidase (beta-lactamase class C family)
MSDFRRSSRQSVFPKQNKFMKIITISSRIVLLTLLMSACLFVQVAAQSKTDVLDKYVEAGRKDWNVPGMSIVVVQDGKVLLSKGYGVRELGRSESVDAQTLFGCMSTTKAMTAVAMGMLVDEGKVSWNDKVIKHLPDFRLTDPYVTNELKVRDLFTHNTGVGNADFLWAWWPDMPSKEVVSRMKHAPQAYSLRGGFVYQNIMYLVAGQMIEKASGMTWERFMRERVFDPLGMKNTFPTLRASRGVQNRTSAHFEIKDKIEVIPEMSADEIGPAGSVWSTADDMGKWINFMLGNTTVNGKELLKVGTLNEIFKPQVILPPGFYPTFRVTKPKWTTYGLGWFQHDYRGTKVDFHTGSLAGRTAIVGLIREKKLGVYIFGNVDHAEVRHALMYKVFDLFAFDDNSRDWSAEFKTLYDGIKTQGEQQEVAVRVKRVANTKPSLDLAAYVGKYADPFYGEITVELANGKLLLRINKDLAGELEHWQFDAFEAVWNQRWQGTSIVKFEISPVAGEVESINVEGAILKRVPK